jgi:hypothetical protein
MWKNIGLGLLGLWTVAYFVLNAVGTLQTAKSLFDNRGTIMKFIGAVLTSQWLPLSLFIFSLSVAFVLPQITAALGKREEPRLRAQIPYVGCSESATGLGLIYFPIAITNSGPRTIVDVGQASISYGPKWHKTATVSNIVYEDGFVHHFSSGIARLKRSEELTEKLIRPLDQGDRTWGWLHYELPGVTQTELIENGFVIRLPFSDAAGNHYTVSQEAKGTFDTKFDVPGVYGGTPRTPGLDDPFSRFWGEPPVERPKPPPPTPDKEASPP